MADLTQLEYFRTVANLQHITRAAEELHISQPNLSNAIKRLEQSLGVKLFDRRNGRVFLNAYGKVFLSGVNDAFASLAAAEKKIAEMKLDMRSEPIAVASSMQLYTEELVESFMHAYPTSSLPVTQEVTSSEEIVRRFWNGLLDEALIPRLEDPPGIITWTPVFVNRVGLLVSASHPLAQNTFVELSELKRYPFVCNNLGIGHDMIVRLCAQGGFVPRIIYESNNSSSIGLWIEKCRGISFISSYDLMTLFNYGPAPENVKVLPFCAPEPTFEMGLARHREKTYTPEQQIFLSFSEHYFQQLGAKIDTYWHQYFDLDNQFQTSHRL